MIRNIIFDIGNVLTDFRWKAFLEDKGFDEKTVERIAKASVQTPLWNEIDRGVWDLEELMQAFIARDPEIEPQLRRAYDNVAGMVTKRDYAIPWIRELKAKGPISRRKPMRTARMPLTLCPIWTAVFCPIRRKSSSLTRRSTGCFCPGIL